MKIRNVYSSSIVILFLVVSGVLLTFSINHVRNSKIIRDNNLGSLTTLSTADATSTNDKIINSKFSTEISNSYNPINVSTNNIQANTQPNQTSQQNIQNAAKASDVNFPIN